MLYSYKKWVQCPRVGTLYVEELVTCPGVFNTRWESAREFGGFLFHVEDHHTVVDAKYGRISEATRLILEMKADEVAMNHAEAA